MSDDFIFRVGKCPTLSLRNAKWQNVTSLRLKLEIKRKPFKKIFNFKLKS